LKCSNENYNFLFILVVIEVALAREILCSEVLQLASKRYLDTCPKNDVVLFSRKGFVSLRGVKIRVRVEFRVR